MKKNIAIIIYALMQIPLYFAFAWIPLIAWNYGLHAVFPQIPTVNYIQIFLISLLVGHIFSRPQFNDLDK